MIILDRHKDCYDYVTKILGLDKTIVFNREKQRANFLNKLKDLEDLVSEYNREMACSNYPEDTFGVDGYIYIGGEIIPFIQGAIEDGGLNGVSKDFYFSKELVPVDLPLKWNNFYTWGKRNALVTKVFSEHQKNKMKRILDKIAKETQTPAFYMAKKRVVHPYKQEGEEFLLKNIKGIPMRPEIMYQNVAMKLGEWKTSEEVKNVDDKYLLKQKGFNKLSFKKRGAKKG